jgi:hypothetical protein
VLNALKSFGCLCPSCSTSSASSQDLLGPWWPMDHRWTLLGTWKLVSIMSLLPT